MIFLEDSPRFLEDSSRFVEILQDSSRFFKIRRDSSRIFYHYSSKCDTDFDCFDKSDEYYCDYLRFGENYAPELIPRDESGGSLTVYMNVSVLAFPYIETINLKFTADFYLNLKWYDLRIDFRDLNNVTSLNTLSQSDIKRLWTPKLGFTNALGPFQVHSFSYSHNYVNYIIQLF